MKVSVDICLRQFIYSVNMSMLFLLLGNHTTSGDILLQFPFVMYFFIPGRELIYVLIKYKTDFVSLIGRNSESVICMSKIHFTQFAPFSFRVTNAWLEN
jgi:hypothetical protein